MELSFLEGETSRDKSGKNQMFRLSWDAGSVIFARDGTNGKPLYDQSASP
jgi:hypothetical protein